MTESITPFAPEAIEQLNEAFKDVYADSEPGTEVVVKITSDSEPEDWPEWLAIAWNKPQMTLGSVYPAAVNDDFLLKMINFDGNVHEVREGDSLAWDGHQISISPGLALN
jgi:hypothetical protein